MNKKAVEKIDKTIDEWWNLKHMKTLTDTEIKKLKNFSLKIELFKLGAKIEGLTLREYLAQTDKEWGNGFLKSEKLCR